MAATRDDIIAALKTVFDPEIPVNIWDMGLVYIDMTFTSPTCPMMEELLEQVRAAVAAVVNVPVHVNLVWEPAWDLSRMSDAARLELDLTEQGW